MGTKKCRIANNLKFFNKKQGGFNYVTKIGKQLPAITDFVK